LQLLIVALEALAAYKQELQVTNGRWKENKGSSQMQSLRALEGKAWGHSRSPVEGPAQAEFGNAAGYLWKSGVWRRGRVSGAWAQSIAGLRSSDSPAHPGFLLL